MGRLIIVFSLFLSLTPAVNAMSRLHTEGPFFKDSSGRTVILRGYNVAGDSKVPPFMPIANTQLLEPLPAMGANVMRLLFTWEAFEPVKGQYAWSYLDYYENIVRWAQANNIYVIVDIHQDAFSRYSVSGCGEGFPAWAIHSSIQRKTPDNGKDCKSWGTKMIVDFDMHKSWKHFYANSEGARDSYLDMMSTISARLKNYSAVIGYDLINEPWGHEDNELSPLYEDAAERIRSHSPQAIIFVSPHALLSSGFGNTKLTKPRFDNYAYSPHYYNPLVITLDMWLGRRETRVIDKMYRQAERWDAPLFLGEFGAPDKTFRGNKYIHALYDALDRRLASGAQWVYTPGWTAERKDGWNGEDLSVIDDQGQTRKTYAPRAYPQVIAGTPIEFDDDDLSRGGKFTLRWQHRPELGETQLYVPPAIADSLRIDVTPSDVYCQLEPQNYRISCSHSREEAVTVTLNFGK